MIVECIVLEKIFICFLRVKEYSRRGEEDGRSLRVGSGEGVV